MTVQVPIICPYCGVGCNLEITVDDEGRPVKSGSAGRNKDLNDRYLCVKGLNIHQILGHPDRLTHPLIRRSGQLERATWDEAVGEASGRLKEIIDRYGPGSVGMLCSAKILNEEAYLCQKFQRTIIGNNNIDNCARLCHGPSEVALRNQLGFGAVSTFLEDFDAVETVFMVGANTEATHPRIWMRIKRRAKKGDINLVIADPRSTGLAKFSTLHLKARPGTDTYWIRVLIRILMDKGWYDQKFIRRHTLGFQAVERSCRNLDVDEACRISGVSRQDLEQAAELIHERRTIFIWGMGLTQHAHGTMNVSALVNLVLLTGNIGKPGCGVAPLRGQNNVQGVCDMGALPNLLPGHMHIGEEAARLHFDSIWDEVPPGTPGMTAPEMIHEIASGKIRAMYIVGENPVMSEPQSSFVAWMMQKLKLLIVQDVYPTETAKYAHILLPAAMVGEKEGSFTNAARRVQFTAKGVNPPGEARPDWEIFQDMARAMDHNWSYRSTKDIWDEVRQAAPIFSGMNRERMEASNGLFWPCYDEDEPDTPRLYENGFAFKDGRARFYPLMEPDSMMEPTPEYPFVLITGRLLDHFNTGEMSRRSAKLMKMTGAGFIEICREDADCLGVEAGDGVRVTSPYGSIVSTAKVAEGVSTGHLFAPNHFKPNLNKLMSSVPLDPHARMPELKVMPVTIRKT